MADGRTGRAGRRPLAVRWLTAFGRFWWDFLIGDTPELFVGVGGRDRRPGRALPAARAAHGGRVRWRRCWSPACWPPRSDAPPGSGPSQAAGRERRRAGPAGGVSRGSC